MRKLWIALVSGLLATGCGIGTAGPDGLDGTPAEVTAIPRLYWVTHDGRLRASVGAEYAKQPSEPSAEQAVRSLLAGPTELVRATNLDTALPEMTVGQLPQVTAQGKDKGPLTLTLPHDVSQLTKLTVGQLVCTAWSAEAVRRGDIAQIEVTLSGGGRRSGPHRCAGYPTAPGPSA
ncbi:GerMN domain-containing protein [Streptomyces olivoreticuli]|uniref:GerMN domain-containing protein n=1 Tax=Streptomyces olivoreticuli TaxID=68246 RepID=UPI00265B0724|nr:GerMN domain-containing protein [Streptomyces olivoreticuli]WKK24302.1 GerMN domain-containing protein [Streptomyces olivoreticuli]